MWWKEFRQLGADDVRKRVEHSIWGEEKMRAARRYLWWAQHALKVTGMVIAIAAVLVAFFK